MTTQQSHSWSFRAPIGLHWPELQALNTVYAISISVMNVGRRAENRKLVKVIFAGGRRWCRLAAFENRSRSRDRIARNSISVPLTKCYWPIGSRTEHDPSRILGPNHPMTSRGLAFIFPKAEEGECATRDGKSEWQGKSSHMDLWWGADTDRARSRACHRPQQFKSNLRHDRVRIAL